jgi:hypothetical protein
MSNYRPISLLTTSKVLEKVMYNRLSHYLKTNNILVPEQFGFRKGISTENAAFKLIDSVLKSLNQKLHVGEIFCDLAKAFDCVNYEILLTKLHYFGIQGATASWFRSYLTDKKQKIEMKSAYATQSACSNWGTIEHGVPQGSILGPLIFIIYINDLPQTVNTLAIPIIFADDTSVIISSKNLDDFCRLANRVVSHMSKWFAANKLALNLDKINIIKFLTNNSPQCPLSIGYNDKYIEESVHTKFLGLQIDNHLNWKNQFS